VEFSVLGTVAASHGGTAIELLWDGAPPPTSRRVLQTYLARLRARLAPYHVNVLRCSDTYQVDVSPDYVDLHRFQKAIAAALTIEPAAARAGALRDALHGWTGLPLGDVATDALRRRIGTAADELHLTAIVRCAEADVAAGDPAAAVERLAPIAYGAPLREEVVAVLMNAYAASHLQGQRRGSSPISTASATSRTISATSPARNPAVYPFAW
jgi:SARP family transcriptional regulator, regulator of embCAB operon